MKLLIVSSPRSGNTWLRYMLARLYHLEQFAVHSPQDLDWPNLPARYIVQLHWHRTLAFNQLLELQQIQPISIIRHPIAVLTSIWQFAGHEPATAKWLSGEGGNEDLILDQPLNSPAFLSYACSERAKALLSVSSEWFNQKGTLHIRYEDLVSNPVHSLEQLCRSLGKSPHQDIQEVINENTLDKLKATTTNNHFWQGQANAWQEMLSPELIETIKNTHKITFEQLGYQ